VFTRQGGVSQGPFAALNVSFSVGDLPEAVGENRRRLAEALGLATLASTRQVHGTEAAFLAHGAPHLHGPEGAEADILITRQPGVGLLIKQADCQAVFLYDPHQRVVANVHCGWRGQVQEILARAVRLLEETFHCQPAHLYAAIGPGLGPCCAQFVNYQREFPREMWGYQVRPGFFDLWRLSRDQLLAAGLTARHIECAELCTRCRPQEFYSYRRDRLTGRQGAVIALAE
jgi:YfiH family protein